MGDTVLTSHRTWTPTVRTTKSIMSDSPKVRRCRAAGKTNLAHVAETMNDYWISDHFR